jgi:hypothetical protein
MRLAIYWAPSQNDPLWQLGNQWLGRNPETNTALPHPQIPNIAELTNDPRHYGFHCTLRPPMRLSTTSAAFAATAQHIAAATRQFPLPPLTLTPISGFLALTLSTPSLKMHALANLCVRATNPHRAPPSPAELARRRAASLTPRQETRLQTWGYPYVLEEWFFHLTLSRRLTPPELASLLPAAQAHFAPTLHDQRVVEEICIFTESPGSDFQLTHRLKLP